MTSIASLCAFALSGATYAATLTEYTIPSTTNVGSTQPRGIAAASDGHLYFTEFWGSRIGRITIAGDIAEYSELTDAKPHSIVELGGILWFSAPGTHEVGRLNPVTGIVKAFPTPSGGNPRDIVVGPDGALWFTLFPANPSVGPELGRLDPDSEEISEFSIPTKNSNPGYLVSGPGNSIWFTEMAVGKIGRISLGGQVTEYGPTPGLFAAEEYAQGIAVGSDGNLWFTVASDRIARMTPAGLFTTFTVPTSNSTPAAITAGPDGALWFTESDASKIGRITTSGLISEYALADANAAPRGISTGPDGAIWFTEYKGNRIGRLEPGEPPIRMQFSWKGFFKCPLTDSPALCGLIRALMESSGTVSGEVQLRLPGSRSYTARLSRRAVRANRPVPIRVQLPEGVSAALEQSLSRGRRLTAIVTLTARDRQGNSHMVRRAVRIGAPRG